MKASEVLARYQTGERDFKKIDLRGQSFQGKNLTNADFSYADIRGANFARADLTGAKFIKAKAGLQKCWAFALINLVLFLLTLSAFFNVYTSIFLVNNFRDSNFSNTANIIVGCVALLTLGLYYFSVFHQGIGKSITVVSNIIFNVTLNIVIYVIFKKTLYIAIIIILNIVFYMALIIIIHIAFYIALTTTLIGTLIVVFFVESYSINIEVIIAYSLITLGLNTYLAYRAYRGDEKDAWLRGIGVAWAATGGTNFSSAILENTDFSQATLKNTNFRNAKLTRTCFRNSKKLEWARVGNTLLTATSVRKLLVNGKGAQQDYTYADFRGANLNGADLTGANLAYADLTGASFISANLQSANFKKVRAVNVDFTQAKLTGACIQAWNIDIYTKLAEIDCLWVYLTEQEQPGSNQYGERRPSSGEFQPGEFTKLYSKILDTVDLIFRKGVNWQTFVTAFDQVRSENKDLDLTIRSVENLEDGMILIKLNVPLGADKAAIHDSFTHNYKQQLSAVEEKYQAQLDAKNEVIGTFQELIRLLASSQPYFDIKNIMKNNPNESQNISAKGDINIDANNSVVNLGKMSGDVSNAINQLPEANTGKPGIKELLGQLQTAIETETELEDKDKAKALRQVKKLANAGENPQENKDDADDTLSVILGGRQAAPKQSW